MGLDRSAALSLVRDWTKNENLVKHMLAVEAEMRALATHFQEDPELWGLVGLLHDLDYERLKDTPQKHPSLVFDVLSKLEVDPTINVAIYAHAWQWQPDAPKPQNKLEWSLFCCDELSGLITAATLVQPDRKIANITVDSVLKKFPNKGFARGVHRDHIEMCEKELGLPLPQFVEICLTGMQKAADTLGL